MFSVGGGKVLLDTTAIAQKIFSKLGNFCSKDTRLLL